MENGKLSLGVVRRAYVATNTYYGVQLTAYRQPRIAI